MGKLAQVGKIYIYQTSKGLISSLINALYHCSLSSSSPSSSSLSGCREALFCWGRCHHPLCPAARPGPSSGWPWRFIYNRSCLSVCVSVSKSHYFRIQGFWSFLMFLDTFRIQDILSFLLFIDTLRIQDILSFLLETVKQQNPLK